VVAWEDATGRGWLPSVATVRSRTIRLGKLCVKLEGAQLTREIGSVKALGCGISRNLMGQKVDGEIIVICPYCHRSAVRRENVQPIFVHETGPPKANGVLETILDSCPKRESVPQL